MEKNAICCFTIRVWTRIIGWLQVIGNLLFILGTFKVVKTIHFLKAEDFKRVGFEITQEHFGTVKPILFIAFLVWTISGLILGIVLLKGTYYKRKKKLDSWITYIIICIVMDSILSIVHAIVTHGTGFGINLCRFVTMQTWNAFCLLVVTTHKDEILSTDFNSNSHSCTIHVEQADV